jgi:hypothetical protein
MEYLVTRVGFSKKDAQSKEIDEQASLRDVPLEIRRREAKKPLYLTRYE